MQELQLLSPSAKYKGIAAFKPNNNFSFQCFGQKDFIYFMLRNRMIAAFFPT